MNKVYASSHTMTVPTGVADKGSLTRSCSTTSKHVQPFSKMKNKSCRYKAQREPAMLQHDKATTAPVVLEEADRPTGSMAKQYQGYCTRSELSESCRDILKASANDISSKFEQRVNDLSNLIESSYDT